MFEPVERAVAHSRGLFGLAPDPKRIEEILRSLSLWDKRGERIMALSGGMKRRVLIAKALAHEPDLLFLDEPTAGVDVELRKGMWAIIDEMRARGVTIILTTHYIEEAEEMADRVGIIPMLFLTPLTFLGGTFYSIDMLPKPWDTIALFNPIVYLVSGLRWTFYGSSDVNIWVSFGITLAFLALCVGVIAFIFKTGWRLRA
jgi:hypothetical protein